MSENKKPGTFLSPLETAEILKSVVQLHLEAIATLTPLIKALEGMADPGMPAKPDEGQEEKKDIDLPAPYLEAIKGAGYKTVADILREDPKKLREKLGFKISEMDTLRFLFEQQGMKIPPEV
jgi:hypothetical protein